jgi:hypothetical protein
MEQYWSGGLCGPDVRPTVDVFVDGDRIILGAMDEEAGVLVEISPEQTQTLIRLLQEAVVRQYLWTLKGSEQNYVIDHRTAKLESSD